MQYDALLDLYKEWKVSDASREDFLKKASQIPGIYVPSLYSVSYKEDGTIDKMIPLCPEAPEKVKKQLVLDVTTSSYPEKPVVPFIKATQDRVVLEIQRGCIRGCRFCQAGMLYRPTRERDLEMLKKAAYAMLKNTGYEEISLSSLSSSDYSHLKELVTFLIDELRKQGYQYFSAVPAYRRIFSGCDGQGAGCAEEQSDLRTGSRFPEAPRCD